MAQSSENTSGSSVTPVSLDTLVQQVMNMHFGEKFEKAPIVYDGNAVTAYHDNLTVTTASDKKIRRALEVFNVLGNLEILPHIDESPVVIEWGKPDAMKSQFVKVAVDNREAYLHAKQYFMPDVMSRLAALGDLLTAPPLHTQINNEALRDPKTFKADETVYVTGTCLFGSKGAVGITSNGKRLELCNYFDMKHATAEEYGTIESIEIMPGYHGYELSSPIERENVLGMINADKVYFNAPLGAYLLYARDAVEKGLMKPEMFESWAQAVTERVEMAVAMEQAAAKCEIVVIDPLYKFIDDILDLKIGRVLLEHKIRESDPWWDKLLEASGVATFTDISYGGYMKAYYDLLDMSDKKTHLIAVETPEEMRIFVGLRSLIQKDIIPPPKGENMMTAIYPFDTALYPDATGQSPGPFASSVYANSDIASVVINSHRGVVDDTLLEKVANANNRHNEKGNSGGTQPGKFTFTMKCNANGC